MSKGTSVIKQAQITENRNFEKVVFAVRGVTYETIISKFNLRDHKKREKDSLRIQERHSWRCARNLEHVVPSLTYSDAFPALAFRNAGPVS